MNEKPRDLLAQRSLQPDDFVLLQFRWRRWLEKQRTHGVSHCTIVDSVKSPWNKMANLGLSSTNNDQSNNQHKSPGLSLSDGCIQCNGNGLVAWKHKVAMAARA